MLGPSTKSIKSYVLQVALGAVFEVPQVVPLVARLSVGGINTQVSPSHPFASSSKPSAFTALFHAVFSESV